MQYEQFVDHVRRRAGVRRKDIAERAIDATLRALGERLEDVHTRAVAAQLPDPLARSLRRWPYDRDFGLEEFYERVSRREGVPLVFAMEHAQVVCQVLTEAMNDEGHKHLVADLPDAFADLFEGQPRTSAPPPRGEEPPVSHDEHTLAGGRPGSRTPLSEGDARGSQPDSVARSPDPRAGRKLSSAHDPARRRHPR